MAAITDLLKRVTDSTTGRPVIAALAAPKAIGAASLTVNDATNWTTTSAIDFSIYEVTAAGIKDPTTQTDWKGTLSGTTISSLTLTGGTDRAYSTGAKVELTPTSRYAKDLYDWGIAHANQDGSLKTTAVQAALNISGSAPADWTALATVPAISASNGQREHTLVYTGVNYTDRLQAGTKLRIPRTGTTPTQSMSFVAASSQYASKTSPTGITFTDDFTIEGWVYLDSYTSTPLVSRRDNTSGAGNGFQFLISSEGRIAIYGYNASAQKGGISYQSIPLGRWTHVAGTLDMSGTAVSLYIDGVSVPLSTSGTASSLVQAGNLQVGAENSINYSNMKVANARVWSTIRTAAQIRDNMNMETPASTTGLVAHFKGNGSWNDSSSNANHLTAVNGAVNNFASHPYSATEYAIATKVTYTGGNTDVTVFTGSGCLPNEALGASSYATSRAPYGFPTDANKWMVSCSILHRLNLAATPNTDNALYTYPGDSARVAIPTGAWTIGYNVAIWAARTSAGAIAFSLDMVPSTTSASAKSPMSAVTYVYDNGATAREFALPMTKEGSATTTAMTNYYLNFLARTSNMTQAPLFGDYQECRIYAECAYL